MVTKQSKYLFLLLALFLYQCGSDDDGPAPLSRIEIVAPDGTRLDALAGETTLLEVTGFDAADNEMSIDGSVVWEVNNANVTVDASGLATGVSVGAATVTASVDGVEATIILSVWDSSQPRTEIFVSDAGPNFSAPWQVLRSFDDGYTEVFTNRNLSWPQDIVVLEDQELVLISNLSASNITQYDIVDGSYSGVFSADVETPTRMEIGADGLLYILQWQGDGLVKRLELDGSFVDSFTDVAINQSIGMAWDTDGNLYVSSFSDGDGGSFVRRFDPDGNDLGLFISSNLQGATDIWFDGTVLFVNDYATGEVKRFSPAGTFLGAFISGLSQNEGVDFLSDGDLLIGNGGTGAVKRFADDGSLVEDMIVGGTLGLATPNAVTVREVNR